MAFTRKEFDSDLAAGKNVIFQVQPNYWKTLKPFDGHWLTRQSQSQGFMWSEPTAATWQSISPIFLTVDLESASKVGTVEISTAANNRVSVQFPRLVLAFGSLDQSHWVVLGALAPTTRATADNYLARTYRLGGINKICRYVQLGVIPDRITKMRFSDGARYFTTNNLRVLEGNDSSNDIGNKFVNPTEALQKSLTVLGQSRRDRTGGMSEFKFEDPTEEELASVLPSLDSLTEAHIKAASTKESQRARQSRLGSSSTSTSSGFEVWPIDRYGLLTQSSRPGDTGQTSTKNLFVVSGQKTSIALALRNETGSPQGYTISVADSSLLTGTKIAPCKWVDTSDGIPVSSALDWSGTGGSLKLDNVASHETERIWIQFDGSQIKPGDYQTSVKVQTSESEREVPIRLHVVPIQLSSRLSVCGWDYADGTSDGGDVKISSQNTFWSFLKADKIDTAWALKRVLPGVDATFFDAKGNLTGKLDFSRLDHWFELTKGVSNRFVYMGLATKFAGATPGTPEFDARLANWLNAIVQHATKLDPSARLGILLKDEPHTETDAEAIVKWTTAISERVPGIAIFLDPRYANPSGPQASKSISQASIICLQRQDIIGDPNNLKAYLATIGNQKETWIYDTTGNSKVLDPNSYRLLAWSAFSIGAKGIGFWSFTDDGAAFSSYNTYSALRTMNTPLYLADDHVDSSLQWEGLKEGITDVAIFRRLQDVSPNSVLASQAIGLLAEVKKYALSHAVAEDWLSDSKTKEMDQLRDKAQQYLIQIEHKRN